VDEAAAVSVPASTLGPLEPLEDPVCWMCDHPDATFDDYVDELLRPRIERFGFAVQAVGGSRVHAPFSYTVGLTALGLPEAVVTGKRPTEAADVLNDLAREPALAGDHLERDGELFEVVAVPHPEAHLHIATGLYGPASVRARQLVWADDRGRWPWERGHRGGRGGQPVLGPRALPQTRAG
jgi:hypothetical protein